jgi:hypothetical protein
MLASLIYGKYGMGEYKKNQSPLQWAGEYPQEVVRENGTSVKVIFIISTRCGTLGVSMRNWVIKQQGK